MGAGNKQSRSLTIWRISDGKAGHDAQSVGLVSALSELAPCVCHELPVPSVINTITGLAGAGFRPARHLSDPDLIIGAGHSTHLPLIAARRAKGGKIIVLMKPSLPTRWFNLCLIPEHDHPGTSDNIILTCGALNTIKPGGDHRLDKGLILIGGPSKHYSWSTEDIVGQIKMLLDNHSIEWVISDSPRTPLTTRQALYKLSANMVQYYPYNSTERGWLAGQFALAGTTWASEDSVSMIYESLTSGTAAGILYVPPRRSGRIQRAIQDLVSRGHITRFEDWHKNKKPVRNERIFNEAQRCARLILERFFPAYNPKR